VIQRPFATRKAEPVPAVFPNPIPLKQLATLSADRSLSGVNELPAAGCKNARSERSKPRTGFFRSGETQRLATASLDRVLCTRYSFTRTEASTVEGAATTAPRIPAIASPRSRSPHDAYHNFASRLCSLAQCSSASRT
jgi:hypothetical protein